MSIDNYTVFLIDRKEIELKLIEEIDINKNNFTATELMSKKPTNNDVPEP